jgi:hypothetical protein
MMPALSLRAARPFAVAALLAAVGFAGSTPVRADETSAPPAEEMVLVPAKTMQTLEQRVVFLEETVAALTESWQHIDTHRICAVDEDNGSETCLTKSRLDALLLHDAHDPHAAIVNVAPQETAKADETADSATPAVAAATASEPSDTSISEKSVSESSISEATPASEPSDKSIFEKPVSEASASETPASEPSVSSAAPATENLSAQAEPETTGSVKPAITGAAVLSFPKIEVYEEPVARSEE